MFSNDGFGVVFPLFWQFSIFIILIPGKLLLIALDMTLVLSVCFGGVIFVFCSVLEVFSVIFDCCTDGVVEFCSMVLISPKPPLVCCVCCVLAIVVIIVVHK